MRITFRGLLAVGALAVAMPAAAQDRPQRDRALNPAERDSLEQRVRVRMGQILKTQLGLSDDQMLQLQATNARTEQRRRTLFEQEREVRVQLRDAMRAKDSTRNAEIATLLDRMVTVQRQRVDLLEAEQKELATFLTPMQRARYFGMEEQVRRRVTEMRDNDRGSNDRGGSGRRPGQGGSPGGKRPPADRPSA